MLIQVKFNSSNKMKIEEDKPLKDSFQLSSVLSEGIEIQKNYFLFPSPMEEIPEKPTILKFTFYSN